MSKKQDKTREQELKEEIEALISNLRNDWFRTREEIITELERIINKY